MGRPGEDSKDVSHSFASEASDQKRLFVDD